MTTHKSALSRLFTRYNLFFLLLIAAENYTLFFYSINLGQQWLNALCYFAGSLLIGLLVLRKFKGKEVERVVVSPHIKVWAPVLVFFCLCLAYFVVKDREIFHQMAIDPKISDVIPTVDVLVHRLLDGSFVYEPITQFGYYLPVTYLPMQWIVFTPAAVWHFDYRWIPLIIWTIGCLWLMVRAFRLNNLYAQILTPLLLVGVYFLIQEKIDTILSTTIETMVAGYYIILMAAMNQKNAILQGVAITLCLLSRYSLVVWLPLWAFVLFVSGSAYRRRLYWSMLTVFVLVLLIYVIPFLSKDWGAWMAGYRAYSRAALGEWESINQAIMKPYQLNTGTGIAFLFAERFQGNLTAGIRLLQRTGMAACLLTIFILGIWYWRHRKEMNPHIFLLASFKIYLSVFLFFIQVPYQYLMIVANFVSIALFAEQLRYVVRDKKLSEQAVTEG